MTLTQAEAARTVQTKDWNLRYYEAGQGKPVILLHGSGPGATGWSNFSGNIEALAKSFHVYAIDMPGWGESDAITPETLDHVETAVQFMDTLGIGKAAFVGNSMGGHTSIKLAIKHPERVSHLITMGAPVSMALRLFAAGDGPSEGLKKLVQAYREPTPENMRQLVEIMCFDKARFATPELCQARSDAALARPEHLKNYLEGLPVTPLGGWANLGDIPKITAPSMFIHGRDDRVVPFEQSLHLVSAVPDSRLVLLNQCGHWAMIEHAEEFNRLVTGFVASG